MKTKFILWIGFLCLLLIAGGCGKDTPSELLGTWKLIGFGNLEGNIVTEAEPKDCLECYTITFQKDGILTGFTATNATYGKYNVQGKQIKIERFSIKTLVNELFDGPRFVEDVRKVTRYEIVSKQLRLYYNEDKDYLLLKKEQQ